MYKDNEENKSRSQGEIAQMMYLSLILNDKPNNLGHNCILDGFVSVDALFGFSHHMHVKNICNIMYHMYTCTKITHFVHMYKCFALCICTLFGHVQTY